mmetsp:Transcript_8449/g.52842  ORF Transcript_8449/g.52842 Transcript_8449/m.52842 type:complete len:340 (-) Transcript_8449:110-1129(-)
MATTASAREVVIQCDDRKSKYNMPLAIFSVFVIFLVSVGGFMLPAYFNTKASRSFRFGVTLCTFLSYAVLLTVGFVHILGDAQLFLSNPCLPEGFLNAYPTWATLICVIAIFISILLDFYGHTYLTKLVRIGTKDKESEMVPINGFTQSSDAIVPVPEENGDAELLEDVFEGDIPSEASLDVKRAAVTFIEVSVCTHSVPVGLALGLENAENFVSLFIAIIFHQVLEGLGIGAAVVDAQYPLRNHIMLAGFFGITAPLGIVIGIVLHHSLNQNSSGYLIGLGSINAFAGGLLIYVAFEHMNAFRSKGKWMRSQGWQVQAVCVGAFVLAGALMLVVGKYA